MADGQSHAEVHAGWTIGILGFQMSEHALLTHVRARGIIVVALPVALPVRCSYGWPLVEACEGQCVGSCRVWLNAESHVRGDVGPVKGIDPVCVGSNDAAWR